MRNVSKDELDYVFRVIELYKEMDPNCEYSLDVEKNNTELFLNMYHKPKEPISYISLNCVISNNALKFMEVLNGKE